MGAYRLGLSAISVTYHGDSAFTNGHVDRLVADERLLVWFDIDNTLYYASANIGQEMGV